MDFPKNMEVLVPCYAVDDQSQVLVVPNNQVVFVIGQSLVWVDVCSGAVLQRVALPFSCSQAQLLCSRSPFTVFILVAGAVREVGARTNVPLLAFTGFHMFWSMFAIGNRFVCGTPADADELRVFDLMTRSTVMSAGVDCIPGDMAALALVDDERAVLQFNVETVATTDPLKLDKPDEVYHFSKWRVDNGSNLLHVVLPQCPHGLCQPFAVHGSFAYVLQPVDAVLSELIVIRTSDLGIAHREPVRVNSVKRMFVVDTYVYFYGADTLKRVQNPMLKTA